MESFSLFQNTADTAQGVIMERWNNAVSVYRAGVARAMRESFRLFSKGIYHSLPSQANTIEEVEQLIDSGKGVIVEAEVTRLQNREYLVGIKARFLVSPMFSAQCFKSPVDANSKGIVDVWFYVGLVGEMIDLIKNNSIINEALVQFEPDQMFDANKVLPVILSRNRATAMSSVSEPDASKLKAQWFSLPSGGIMGVKVEGYSVINQKGWGLATPKASKQIHVGKDGKSSIKQS